MPDYKEERVKKCRTRPFDAHSLAVVAGAFVSPAAFFQMKKSKDQNLDPSSVPPCPFCGLVSSEATLEHVVWSCPNNGRPAHVVPADSLEKRLGWPLGNSDACLRWFARVRHKVQEARYA